MILKKIQECVARRYGVSVGAMLSSSRDSNVAEARRVAMYVARKYTTKSLPEISAAFNKTHASVIHAVRTVEKRVDGEEDLKASVQYACGWIMAEEAKPRAILAAEDDARWQKIQAYLQEAAVVIDYLHWRVLGKRYGERPGSPLFAMAADSDGELTEESVVGQLEAIARQARAGFCAGDGFPVFGSFEGRAN